MADPNLVCYGWDAFLESEPWPYGHFRIGFIHQILVHNFFYSLLLHYANESFEVLLATSFSSYLIFLGANTNFENMTESLLGDMLQGLLGILTAIVIQRYVTYIPRLIVYIEDDVWRSVLGWIVLLLFGLTGQFAGIAYTFGGQKYNFGVLISIVFDIVFFYLILIWGIFGSRYDDLVWSVGSAQVRDKRRAKWHAFWAITVIIVLFGIPAIPITISTYFKVWFILVFVIVAILAASLFKYPIHYHWPKRYYGAERK